MTSTAAGFQGAANGAMIGTAIMPGWGTAIGGLAGGLYGYATGNDTTSNPYADSILMNGYNSTIGGSKYQGNYDALIRQLQASAAGGGPNVAQMAYQQAADKGYNNLQGMAGGGGSAQALQAARSAGGITQGLAQGYGRARLEEMQAAQGNLNAALQGADSMDFRRKKANQDAYMQALSAMMGQQTQQQHDANTAQMEYSKRFANGVAGYGYGDAQLGK